jgi:hypothetical protein
VVIGALAGLGIGMYKRGGQPRQCVQQIVLGLDRDPVGLDRGGTGVDDDFAFGAQLVPVPPQPGLANIQRPGVARKVCSTRSTRAGRSRPPSVRPQPARTSRSWPAHRKIKAAMGLVDETAVMADSSC